MPYINITRYSQRHPHHPGITSECMYDRFSHAVIGAIEDGNLYVCTIALDLEAGTAEYVDLNHDADALEIRRQLDEGSYYDDDE